MKNLVVIPAYNEEAALPGVVASLQALPDEYELLIVDDGSRDGTRGVADGLARAGGRPVHVVHLPLNAGIGVAVQTGYLFAARDGGYRYVLQCDADGQHDAADLPALVKACEERGLDLCIGSRFLGGAAGFRSTWPRRLGIRFFARLIGLLSGLRVTDPTSGLRCAGPRAWACFAERYPDDYPEPESLFWCVRNRLRVGEVPVRMHARQGGASSIRWARAVYYVLKVSLGLFIDRLRSKELSPR